MVFKVVSEDDVVHNVTTMNVHQNTLHDVWVFNPLPHNELLSPLAKYSYPPIISAAH